MGRKVYIAIVLGIVLLLGGAVGAYAWDESQSDEIAEGVKVGGVDVGGMSESEAEKAVASSLVEPLDKPVTVTYDGVKYNLSAERLDVRADVTGSVEEAFDVSQEGGLPSRLWRYATGGEVNESIRPRVAYSQSEVDEFIDQVEADVDSEPVNASVEPTGASIEPVAGQVGHTLEVDELRTKVEAAIESSNHRKVKATADTVEPEVTTKDLAEQYPTYITVNRTTFELKLWKNLELAETYTIALGAEGYDTPTGEYTIQNKAVDPVWSVPDSDWAGKLAGTTVPGGVPENPLKARWMGIYDGAGIHGTSDTASLGSAASHGCVRMSVDDVIDLYDQVPVGTPIYIG